MRARHINVLSYNLHFHAAYGEVFILAKKHEADVICLQECAADELKKQVNDFILASHTKSTNLGLAVYYRKQRFRVISYSSYHLAKSLYEKLARWDHERALIVNLYDVRYKQTICFASFHATHLVASNSLRRLQLEALLRILNESGLPVVVAGDYNYPIFHNRLKMYLQRQGFRLYVPASITYQSSRFRGKFDLIATKDTKQVELKVLPKGKSDHMAVLASVAY